MSTPSQPHTPVPPATASTSAPAPTPTPAQAQAQAQADNNLQAHLLTSLVSLLRPNTNATTISRQDLVQILLGSLSQLIEIMKQGKMEPAQVQALKQLIAWQKARSQAVAAQHARVQAQAQAQSQPGAAGQAQNSVAAQGKPSQPPVANQSNSPTPAQPNAQTTPTTPGSTTTGLKRKSAGDDITISAATTGTGTNAAGAGLQNGYTIPPAIPTVNPGPQPWPSTSVSGRPTLTGGLPAGRMSGTPSQLERVPEDLSMYSLGDGRVGPRKMTPADQSLRRSIQDLVSSIDPNVRVEQDVEDLLLDIADEFIDSVTNFGCRLAKHRKGDTLEVRDLQLHLERNHNIRIPGFTSDETRVSISQSGAPAKKATQGTHMTLRSSRLAAVQQGKKDGKTT